MDLQKIKEELIVRLDNDKKIYELVEIIDYLFGKNNKNLDLFEMNQWLFRLIEFYKVYGIELTVDDFNVSDYKNNNYLKKYMMLYFDNRDRLDDDMFSQIIFSMSELEISTDANNPIMGIMNEAVHGISVRNIKILDRLFNYINANLSNSIVKANFGSIGVVKKQLAEEIELCTKLLDEINNKKYLNTKIKNK